MGYAQSVFHNFESYLRTGNVTEKNFDLKKNCSTFITQGLPSPAITQLKAFQKTLVRSPRDPKDT